MVLKTSRNSLMEMQLMEVSSCAKVHGWHVDTKCCTILAQTMDRTCQEMTPGRKDDLGEARSLAGSQQRLESLLPMSQGLPWASLTM